MRRFALLLLYVVGGLLASPAAAQNQVTWTSRLVPADARAGESAQIVMEAAIESPWHLYSMTPREVGPKPTSFEVLANKAVTKNGDPVQPPPHTEHDRGFNIDVEIYEHAVAFGIPVKLADGITGAQKVPVMVRFMACKEGMCTPPMRKEIPVAFTVAAGPARPDRTKPITEAPKQPKGYEPPPAGKATGSPNGDSGAAGGAGVAAGTVTDIKAAQSRGLLPFLLLAVGAGFLALLTPCVFPMVPITVSFFSKQQEDSPGAGVGMAVAYCLGIIGTFTGLGLLLSVVAGAAGLNRLATNEWLNLALAGLFIFLALSLFGLFELQLPSWLVDKAQGGTQRGRFLGPFFMGLTFTLTSFTCTVPFVGGLLATATRGDLLWPFIGMLGFSAAFASPFFLLALFPQWLARVPQSGPWLVTTKAFMGFLELAAAVKFLSNVDLRWQLGLITRPVFLALWFTIALIAAAYMLGWLRLPHDAGGSVGPFRRAVGIATGVAAVCCLLAINGFSLGSFDAFPPRADYAGRWTFSPATSAHASDWLENYEEAREQARATGKLLFVNFTGEQCTNCRLMEAGVFPKPEVRDELSKFVKVELFTDRETPESRRYQELQAQRFGQTTLPLYVVLRPQDESKVAESSYNADPKAFAEFLRNARAAAGSVAQNSSVPTQP
jgi:thiol:disulfide interchange protein